MCAAGVVSANVTIAVTPAKVELATGGETTATVLVSNVGKRAIRGLEVKPVVTGRSLAEATIRPDRKRTLAVGESGLYELFLGPWAQTPPLSTLTLLATYRTKPPQREAIRQATTSTVELVPPAPLEVDKAATVEVKASLGSLRTGETQSIYLLVHNKAAFSLSIEDVIASKPSFIRFPELEDPWDPVSVGPGEVSVLTLQAKAASEVAPGDHQLVFRLPSTLGAVGFDLVGSETVTVGVTGESELLTVFGIPSLLILPGFLLLVTAGITWESRLFRREWDGAKFGLPAKEPQFWVVAVVFSILIILPAQWVGIDLLGEYGLQDLIWLWLASMGIGLFGCCAFIAARNHHRAARVPGAGDDPIVVLDKLAKLGLDLRCPRITLDVEGSPAQLFLVQPLSEARPSTWASPPITYTWVTRDRELGERIRHLLDDSHDAKALAGCLRDGVERGLLTVDYDGKPNAPTLVEKANIANPVSMVIVEERE